MNKTNIKTSDWYAINKCARMVDTYIKSMDNALEYTEWPEPCYPPLYLSTLEAYLTRVYKSIGLYAQLANRNGRLIWRTYKLKPKNAKQAYMSMLLNRLNAYKIDLGLK